MTPLGRLLSRVQGTSGFATIAQTGAVTVLVLGVNVATGMVSARVLGAQGRGELSALLLLPQFLSFLFTLGLPAATIVRIKAHPDDEAGLMGSALLLTLPMGLLAAAIGFLLVPFLMRQYDAHAIGAARALLLFVTSGVCSTVLIAALQLRDRFRAYNQLRFWQSALTLLLMGALALAHRFDPVSGALAYVLPTLPFFVWNLHWVLKELAPSLTHWRRHCRVLVSVGWRVHVMDIGNALFGQIDKLILVAVLAPSIFGVYVVVFNLSRLVTTFANSAIPILLPRAAGKGEAEILALTSRTFSAAGALTAAAVLGFVAFGSLGLRILYGAQFLSGYWMLVILSVEGALASGAAILQQSYLLLNRPGVVAACHVLSLVLALGLIYLGALRFGPEGAACGMLLATAARFVLTYGGYRRVLDLRAPRLLPSRADLALLLTRARAALA